MGERTTLQLARGIYHRERAGFYFLPMLKVQRRERRANVDSERLMSITLTRAPCLSPFLCRNSIRHDEVLDDQRMKTEVIITFLNLWSALPLPLVHHPHLPNE